MKKRNIYKEDFCLEEAIFDDFSKKKGNFESLELPLSKQAFALMVALVLFFGGIAGLRILYLGVWKGSAYAARASANVGKEIYQTAPRGIIYDRYGKILADNSSSFSAAVKPAEFFKDEAMAENNIKELSLILEIPEEELRGNLANFNSEKDSLVILARNIDSDKIIQLKALNMAGVEIMSDYKRIYPDGAVFSPIIGYTGMDKKNNIVGKSGLEAYYDSKLDGIDGKTVVFKNVKGETIGNKVYQLVEQGKDLNTTIDAEFQKYFYNVLSKNLSVLGKKSGIGLAMNPQTGEVLSLISLPSYDNNVFISGSGAQRKTLLNSTDKPLFNRVVSGTYTPGSTIKPLVALAALKEGVMTTDKKVYSAGYIEIPNPYDPENPSRFLDWKAHGWVDFHSALAVSSNVYFYSIGGGWEDIRGLGIDKLRKYWEEFGLGKKTGIDLTGEATGFLPDPEEKEKRTNDIWRIGDTYNVSIGQGDLQVTPLQLLSFISAVANGGKFYQPYLLKDKTSNVLIDFSNLENYLKEVRIGMEDCVSKTYGTAKLLSYLPVSSAGKTGSSQTANNTKVNAFFVGYMPAENPQIAVAVLMENVKGGSANAVPVAKDVLEWYYYNRLAK
ncbi:MAG: penicillin-binding protein 2 [Candidatus Pacebacteria bacterium]|nr:penicillin-binding protein 2 [Candidatus Paceibacterota bacterium]